MRLIAKAAPAAVAAPLFIATPMFVTACASASSPAASATAATTASAAAPASSAESAPAASSGGSFGSLTADQIASKANADLKAATSFRVTGVLRLSGVTEDINLTSAGGKCSGKIAIGGTPERFVQIGGTLWVSAGNTSMYLKTSASGSQNSQVFALCAPGQIASVVGPLPGLTKNGTVVIGGRRVEKLSDSASGSIEVTISGTPQYVRFAVPGETLTFSGINAPASISPPPASDVVGD